MEVLFLGTCAYDYSPLLETTYKDVFHKDARRSSCALINGKYLIDCGDHCLEELRIAKIDLAKITDIFVTHFHRDHYNLQSIAEIAKNKKNVLRLWVREDADVSNIPNVEIKKMRVGQKYDIEQDFYVESLLANHDEASCPQHFLFERKGKKILYACDGAWFLNQTWYRLKCSELDLLILDATCGDYLGDYRIGEHNTIPMIRIMLPSLKSWRVITEKTQVYLSHIAPSLHKAHQETVKLVQADGLKVAYDGLKIDI